MQAHHDEKMKELVYPPTEYCALLVKFVSNILLKGFIGWRKNGELLSWTLQTASYRQKKCFIVHIVQAL